MQAYLGAFFKQPALTFSIDVNEHSTSMGLAFDLISAQQAFNAVAPPLHPPVSFPAHRSSHFRRRSSVIAREWLCRPPRAP